MKISKLFSRISALTLLLSGTCAMAADYKKLDQYLTNLVDNDKAMLSVAIHQGGKLVYEYAGGFSDEKRQNKLSTDSKFRIGSITKTYTAVVVLKLAEQGKLSLEDKLSKYFPEVADSDNISIKQLLRHESGLFNFTNAPEYLDYMYQAQSNEQLMKKVLSYDAVFQSGTSQEYSNTNFLLLGFIAEKITGKSLTQLIAEIVTEPLGVKSTYLSSKNTVEDGEVWSYRYQGDWQPLPNTHLSIPQGAGAVVSNAEDVSLFLTKLFSGKILTEASLAKMTEMKQHLGLGVMEFPFYDRRAIGHNGGIDGFNSNASYFAKDKVSAVVLSNGINYNFNDILIAVLSAQFDKPFEVPEFSNAQVALTKLQLGSYTGDYSSDYLPLDIKVFMQDETLMAQASGQGAFELTSFSDTEFRFEPAGITIKFTADKSGFVLIQGGGEFPYERN